MHAINNFVEILGWEGETNVRSILPHSYRSPDLLRGLPGHSNTVTKEAVTQPLLLPSINTASSRA